MKPEPMQHAKAFRNSTSPIVKWFDQHGNTATAILCVAMIGGAIWFSYHRTTSARSETAWAAYSQSNTAKDFGDIADLYESTEVGAWARLSEGERYLEQGIALMFTDRAAGLGELEAADKSFRKVLDSKSAANLARERALWGLAKSTETQSDGDTTKAIEAYQALLTQFPKTIYKAAAEERIESLKSGRSKEFYAWFHKQKPKPPDLKKPKDGLPAGHPPIDMPLDDKSEDDKSETKKPDTKDDSQSEDTKSDDKKVEKKPVPTDSPDDNPKDGDKPTIEPSKTSAPPKKDAPKEDQPKSESEDKDAPADSK
ncbi:MAG TPA: tetratricopeptide repeat protein [Planctomycetaceae bacterium]|nr:tetratricopeptide repeat protein [Planctomycetaceae bacterium]